MSSVVLMPHSLSTRLAHGAIFLQRKLAQTVQKFLAGDMPVGVLAAPLERLQGMIEAFLDEVVRIGRETQVRLANLFHYFSEVNFGHVSN